MDVVVEMGSPGQLVGWKPEWLWFDVKIPLSPSQCVCVLWFGYGQLVGWKPEWLWVDVNIPLC